MNKSTLNKLLLSRSLYQLAKENIKTTSGLRLSIACNLLQDAVEGFLLALSEHVNADIGQGTQFDKYFQQINLKIAPRELPFRLRLISLNKLRVNSKHYGLEPAKSELEPLFTTVWEFFNEVTRSNFGKEFAMLSLVDMLLDSEEKELLREAEAAFEAFEYPKCLILCRQAIFLKFEWSYDAQQFSTGMPLGLSALISKVPHFARNQKYLDENVKEPTDYVIYDRDELEMELMKRGVDSVAYWNVWRLTPEVYRNSKSAPWVVKNDLSKLDSDGIKDRAEYALFATTEILFADEQNQTRIRNPDYRRFCLMIKNDAVPVFEKASKASTIIRTTPAGVRKLYCDYSIDGLDEGGTFWHVTHCEDHAGVFGFIHEDALDS